MKYKFFYGWIVVASCLVVVTVANGARFSFGVFLLPLRESFDWSSAATSGVYSLCVLVSSVFGIFTGVAVDKYGPRITVMFGGILTGAGLLLTSQINALWQLYLTFGVIMGLGLSTVYTPLMSTVSRWFTRQRGLALGIFSTGFSIGPLLMAPPASYLILTRGWQFSYIVVGLSAGLILVAALFLRRPQSLGNSLGNGEAETDKTNGHQLDVAGASLREGLHTKAFWALCFMQLMIGISIHTMMVHLVAYSESQEVSAITAATILSTVHGSSIVGRIVMGTMSDRIGRNKTLALCAVVGGISVLWLVNVSSAWMLFVCAMVYGFAYGGHVPIVAALTGELLGLQRVGTILGATAVFWGIGGIVGPILAGYLFDLYESYSYGLALAGVAMLCIAMLMPTLRKR